MQRIQRRCPNSFPDITWVTHSEVCAVCDNRSQPGAKVSNGFVSRCSDIYSQEYVLLSYVKILLVTHVLFFFFFFFLLLLFF